MAVVVEEPMSAWSRTSSRLFSLVSRLDSPSSEPKAPFIPDRRRSRLRASPFVNLDKFSASILLRSLTYADVSCNASPSLPSAALVAMFCICARPSSERLRRKSKTMTTESRDLRKATLETLRAPGLNGWTSHSCPAISKTR